VSSGFGPVRLIENNKLRWAFTVVYCRGDKLTFGPRLLGRWFLNGDLPGHRLPGERHHG
jgi:hypothetical protein